MPLILSAARAAAQVEARVHDPGVEELRGELEAEEEVGAVGAASPSSPEPVEEDEGGDGEEDEAHKDDESETEDPDPPNAQ